MSTSRKPAVASVPEFWKLVSQSRLYTSEQCRKLHGLYSERQLGTPANKIQHLVEWLVGRKYLTRYQAKVILAGKSGPFFYGDYKLLDRIGQGRLQGSFKAMHVPTRHQVLLNFVAGEVAQDPQCWAAFVQGAAVLCQLEHPNLHRWYELVDLGNFKFLVCEDLPGQSLDTTLEAGKLEVARACWLTQQAARGFEALQGRGWVHGNVRPQNLWVTPTNNLKVLLHGLLPGTSLAADDESIRADYAAPEVTQRGATPNVLSDIYALGCTFYQMLAAQVPFPGGTVAEKINRHASEPIRPLAGIKAPQNLGQVMAYMMAKNPAVRYQRMADVEQNLTPLVGDEPHLMPPTPPLAPMLAYQAALAERPQPTAPLSAATAMPATAPMAPAVTAPLAAPLAVPIARPFTGQIAAPITAPGPIVSAPIAPHVDATYPTPAAPAPEGFPTDVISDLGKITTDFRGGSRRRRRKRSQPWLLVACVVFLAASAVGVWVAVTVWPSKQQTVQQNNGDKTEGSETTGTDSATSSGSNQPMPDDGKTLWSSPTAGSPIDFRGVPAEALLTIVMRPAEMAKHEEGARVLKALGETFEGARQTFEEATKVAFSDAESLIITLHDQGEELPRPAFLVRLAKPVARDELLSRWGKPQQHKEMGDTYFSGDKWSYYLPTDQTDEISSFVCGGAEEIKFVAERKGAPPPPRSGTEPLVRASDSTRMLTIFFVPHFWQTNLLRDGRIYYFGDAAKLREPLNWFLGDGLRAGLFSFHIDNQTCYVELQIVSDVTRDKYQLATDLRERLNQIPDKVETYIAERLNPPEFWRRVAFRYPQMIRFLHEHSRVQVENNLAVLNAVLPLPAAHNLVFATEMVLASTPSTGVATAVASAAPTGPKTIEDVLNAKIDLQFDQLALEAALGAIVTDIRETYPKLPFEFDVKIIGPDFEKGSITRNQQIVNFTQKNVTVAEVLTAIAMRANPVTTVKSPTENDQKLVWVVGPDPDKPTRTIVLLTTRDGAATRKLTLPKVFQN